MTRSEYNNLDSLLLCSISVYEFVWGGAKKTKGNYFHRRNYTCGKEQTVLMIKLLSLFKTSFPSKSTVKSKEKMLSKPYIIKLLEKIRVVLHPLN